MEGNPYGDNFINLADLYVLSASYGINLNESGYYDNADFYHNGIITLIDFGLLAKNYEKTAPVEVP